MSNKPSELAQAVARLATAYPDRAAVDLHELLAHHLSVTSPAEERENNLGLLVELFEELGRMPNRETYREEQGRREAAGRRWSSSDELEGVFGKWEYVLSAALYVAEDRADNMVRRKDDGRIAPNRKIKYTRDEVKDALIACFETLGDWPRNPSEYAAWVKLHRRHALLVDSSSEEWMPTVGVVRKKFGTWERAIELAKKKYALRF